MAILHLFNPEHDIAMASNLSNFTAPHAGRQLRQDLDFLPAIWAASDDYVLVGNADDAQTAFSRLMHRQFLHFVEKRQLAALEIERVEPWGWDLPIRSFLLRYGVDSGVMPTEHDICVIRDLSHRKTALDLRRLLLVDDGSFVAISLESVSESVRQWGRAVLKAPWSSSGRGIRFIDHPMNDNQVRWIKNVISRQGCVIVEPYYNKVKDFAMEFESDGRGGITCLGLSLFHTTNGAYTGNILASEEEKREIISRYVSLDLIDSTQQNICRCLGSVFNGKYSGPFGVDMMIVTCPDADKYYLHPCVEINLRRTMGHVALSFDVEGVMRIEYLDNSYKLKVTRR